MRKLCLSLGLAVLTAGATEVTWPNVWSDDQLQETEFAVWGSTNLTSWQLLTVTTNLFYVVPINAPPAQFFRVSIAPRGYNK